jgi:5,10-methylenetetrahydromethanopterin reductase
MTPKRQVSIAFQTDKTPAEYRELAQLVNRYDFDVVSVYGDLPYQPSIGPLLLMAPHLDRARIGTACLSPSRVSPLDMAGDIALLDQVTGGRAYLGIARGAWLNRHGVRELSRPITAIRESVEIVQRLFAGASDGYQGKVYKIEPGVKQPYSVQRSHVPILIGTWGPKLAGIAGELADEVKIGGCTNKDMIGPMRAWIAAGEERAKRTPGSVGIVVGAVTVVDEDSRAAKMMVKRDLALYLPVVASLDITLEIDIELLARMGHLVDQGQRDDAAALISDDLLAKFAFAGSPDEIAAHAQALFEAGASRVEFGTPHGIRPQDGIRLLGQRVLPALNLAPR